jgi:hypothetical protein
VTAEEELQKLIEEQRRDDTYRVSTSVPYGFRGIPLDRPAGEGEATLGDTMVGVMDDGEFVVFLSRDVEYEMNTTCGLVGSYTNRGCRCPACTEAQRVAAVAWYAKNRKQAGEARTCEACGGEFHTLQELLRQGKTYTNNLSRKKYCSRACQLVGYRERDSARQRARRAAARQQRQAVAA